MNWSFGEPHIYNGLFFLFLFTGLGLGSFVFALLAFPRFRPGPIQYDPSLPRLAGLVAVLIICSFTLLAFQMTEGRFFHLEAVGNQLTLSMANDDRIVLSRKQINGIQVAAERSTLYLVIISSEREYLRSGPCGEDCHQMHQELMAWWGQDEH